MAPANSRYMADASANTNAKMARTSLHPSAGSKAYQDDDFMRQFGAVLAQLKVGNIGPLAVSVRQNMQARDSTEQTDPSQSTDNTVIGCKVSPEPLRGSYNIAYRVLFDDGVEWILKVPANGSHARFDRLAADAMTSEALTMKMIKQSTTIPVPAVHSFDVSSNNEVGCPYILMDFLKGRPLYEGWFDPNASSAKREQFRARALQTTAAAMVQLSTFTLHRGGALRFDSAGQPVDVAGAKVPDAKAFYDTIDGEPYPEHDVWCENGPTTDPSSYLLFMLNRRGYKKGDSAYSRGVRESAGLFTKWALELSDNMDHKEQQFVLAHPDFDIQNILVHDDGTLSGILDWDGVAAVPLSVGCLRYPNWLIRDWDPVNYNWDIEAHEPKSYSGRPENTPDELVCYRAMYAQFIEMLLPTDSAGIKTGKMEADIITRMSLITESLEVAVNRPMATGQIIGHLYREIKRITGEEDDNDSSVTVSLESGARSNISDGDDSETDSLASGDGVEDGSSDEDTAPTEIEQSISGLSDDGKGKFPECLCQKCITILHHSSPEVIDEEKDENDFLALDATREGPEFEQDGPEMALSDQVPAKAAAHKQKAASFEKAGVAGWASGLSDYGPTGIAKTLNNKAATGSKPSGKVRVVKWALKLGEKGCKEASKVLHKKEAYGSQPKDRVEATPAQFDAQPDSKTATAAIRLCNRTETLLRQISARMHQDRAPGAEGSNPKETKTKRVQTFLNWLITVVKKMIRKPVKDGVEVAEMPTITGGRLPHNIVLVDIEHCQRCNPVEESPDREQANDQDYSVETNSDDVWAHIAAEIDKSGIPADLIKKRQDVVAQCVIENLGQEIEREKETELYLNDKKATRTAKKAKKRTEIPNTKHESHSGPIQPPASVKSELAKPSSVNMRVAKTEAAQTGMPEELEADVEDGKLDETHRFTSASLDGVEGFNSEEIEKPEPENAECPKSSILTPGDPDPDAVDMDHIRPYNYECGSSEPESLISKLEAAKQRFDMEMALKGQNSGSMRLVPGNTGVGTPQLGDSKQQTSTHDAAAPEAIEEANRKLRMILSSFAKPRAASSRSESNVFQIAEDDGAATARLGSVQSSGAIDIANQKLKAMLSSLQEPVAADAGLQSNMFQIIADDDEEPESRKGFQTASFTSISLASPKNVPAQFQKAVKGGRWFETPKGSLKRIEDEERVNDSSNVHEMTSRPSSYSLEDNGGSSETSVANRDDENVAKVCDFQLLFPNHNQSEAFNVLQTPGVDENVKDYEEEYGVEGFTRSSNGGEFAESEEGEVQDEEIGLLRAAQGSLGEKIVDRVSAGGEELGHPGPKKTVDRGNFTMSEVCVALGNGNLDEQRMRKLKVGFMMVLAEALGKI
ncbi:hypothetical protein HO133_005584 [Letharia lupina]|uniref:Aminoglycoside phosphotransferase domain-containing protein n=1 Tax=Letharia lupina TaxID=560253 RepID=A0A8H6C8Y7_9LECA|nr:uncharacterized protein HO133_005584 [Letharia lupina]KAF6219040.1 hypothetical protein HO133_005584 [Letharia lupina]